MSPDAFQRAPGPDPQGEAEKQLMASLAREARETLGKVKYASYGCLVLVALGIILAILL